MPTSIEITLELPKNEKIHQAMGSIMQGVLMEIIGIESAKKLHEDGLRPYSQYIYFNKTKNLPMWRVNVLNDWAYEKILLPLTRQHQIFLKHKNYYVNLLEHNIITTETYEDIAEHFMNGHAPISKGVDINFLTTASFRRDNQYVIFPEFYLIIQSLLNRWNHFSEIFEMEDDLPKVLSTFCRVKEYELRTQPFLLEHQKIIGFGGSMSLEFDGNYTVNNLLALLFKYANYAGIGIKTALGMGATSTELK